MYMTTWEILFYLYSPFPFPSFSLSLPPSLPLITDEPYSVGPRCCFFPPLFKFDPPYPIAPDGHLPNSALLQKLRKSDEDRKLAQSWKPPTLSDKQRQLMLEHREGEEEEEEEEDSDLMNRLKAAMMADEGPASSPSPPSSPPTPESPVVSDHTHTQCYCTQVVTLVGFYINGLAVLE